MMGLDEFVSVYAECWENNNGEWSSDVFMGLRLAAELMFGIGASELNALISEEVAKKKESKATEKNIRGIGRPHRARTYSR